MKYRHLNTNVGSGISVAVSLSKDLRIRCGRWGEGEQVWGVRAQQQLSSHQGALQPPWGQTLLTSIFLGGVLQSKPWVPHQSSSISWSLALFSPSLLFHYSAFSFLPYLYCFLCFLPDLPHAKTKQLCVSFVSCVIWVCYPCSIHLSTPKDLNQFTQGILYQYNNNNKNNISSCNITPPTKFLPGCVSDA